VAQSDSKIEADMMTGRFSDRQEIVGMASGRFRNVLGTNIILNGRLGPMP
jgi:hypothetical protein